MKRSILDELLLYIRRQFFADTPKAFFQQRNILLQCVTYPAKWFDERGLSYPESKYAELVRGILLEIMRHGDTSNIRHFGGYLLHCIQQHLKHQGERYIAEAKSLDRAISDVIHGLKAATKSDAQIEADAVRTLAAVSAALRVKKASKTRKTQSIAQQELF